MARQERGMNVLNVAEKNDAAKEISRVLSSGRSQRVGFHRYMPGENNVNVLVLMIIQRRYVVKSSFERCSKIFAPGINLCWNILINLNVD